MSVQCDTSGDIAVVTIDNPPVNAASQAVRQRLVDAMAAVASAENVVAAVVIGAGRSFVAGADIREFGKPSMPPDLNEVIAAIESSEKPIIIAIHGVALGGGLELSLSGHYRIALKGSNIGLPEVKLGLLPGAGGTQRLPRLVGVQAALDAITTGDMIPVEIAAEKGVIDKVVDGDLLEHAKSFAREKAAAGGPHPVISQMPAPKPESDDLFDTYKANLERRSRGQMSPIWGLEAVRGSVDLPFAEGLKQERALFNELMASDQSKGMIHSFFAEREAAKIPGLPKDTKTRKILQTAVIGCGTMGGGITMSLANGGMPVTVVETSEEALDRGLEIIRKNYASTVSKGRLSQDEMDARMARITGTTNFTAIADVDLVIEAVFEELALKKEVFAKLDAVCKKGAVLATNTSTLDIDQIAAMTTRPEDVIGMHFFSPANVMKLLEVVRGEKTSAEVIQTAMKFGRAINKVTVLVRVCDGFVGNRILHHYSRQAGYMIEDGAMPQDVDRVMVESGMPMGIFAMGDLAGMDVGWRVRKHQAATRPNHLRYSDVADRICEQGRFGQKTGAGWYKYEAGSRKPIPDLAIEQLIMDVAKEKGIQRREFSDEEIHKRIFYQMVNEGAKILEEGLAIRSSDIDVIYVNGYAFPPYRGGPMFEAERIGLASVLEDIKAFQARDGQGWEPAPLLERLVAEGKSFKDLEENL